MNLKQPIATLRTSELKMEGLPVPRVRRKAKKSASKKGKKAGKKAGKKPAGKIYKMILA